MGIKASPPTVRQRVGDAMDKTFNVGHVRDKMQAEKAAADAKANRKEAEAEGQRYAAGGLVGKQSRGFGKARRGS